MQAQAVMAETVLHRREPRGRIELHRVDQAGRMAPQPVRGIVADVELRQGPQLGPDTGRRAALQQYAACEDVET